LYQDRGTMKLLAAILATATLTTSACSFTPTRHRAAAAVADLSALAGTVLYVRAATCEEVDGNGRIDCLDAAMGWAVIGGALTVLTLAAGGYALTGWSTGASAAPADATPAAAPAPEPAAATIVMPARDADPDTRRLALQAQSAARRGQCSAARVILHDIAERDRPYHDALISAPAFAICQ